MFKLDGLHRDLDFDSDDETTEQKLLGDLRDLRYVKHKHSIERKVKTFKQYISCIILKVILFSTIYLFVFLCFI